MTFLFRCALICFVAIAGLSQPAFAAPQPQAIEQQIRVLKPYQSHIHQRFKQSRSLVDSIFSQLKQQSLPLSFVLVPMLESSFDVNAVSHANAAGLWQLIPATAKRFGLRVDAQHDQRFDSHASTQAALQYLKFLYRKFDQNLALTLAAYNAGEGRVARAIKRAGSRQFDQLKLPKETRQYVHRFFALLTLVDVNKLQGDTFQPLFLFSQGKQQQGSPLIDLSPLPPLISL